MIALITGVMAAGKTKELIDRIDHDDRKKKLILKPAAAKRDGNLVRSRALGHGYYAVVVDEANSELVSMVLDSVKDNEVIYVDEIQLFGKQFMSLLLDKAVRYGVDVIGTGLERGFLNKPFPTADVFTAYADMIDRLLVSCQDCEVTYANRSILIDTDGHMVETGDQEDNKSEGNFKSVCNSCATKRRKTPVFDQFPL